MFSLENYNKIKEKVEKNKKTAKIIAISKFHSQDAVIDAINKGIRLFGENRVQEAYTKFNDLKARHNDIELHFTGSLQTNKIKQAIHLFDVFHTIFKEKQLIEFSKFDEELKNKKFFIQVNTGLEESKSGIFPKDVKEFTNLCTNKYNLNVEGLMCIPPINEMPTKHFKLLKDLNKEAGLSKLSMGMSGDYEEAINCGSDYIRIGTLLFGSRK